MEIIHFVHFVQIAIVISCCCATYVKPFHSAVFRPPMHSRLKPFHKPEIYKYPMKPFFRQPHPPMFPAMIKPPFKVIPVLKSKRFMKPFSNKMMPVMIKKVKYMKVPKIPFRHLRPKSPPKHKLPTPVVQGNVVTGYRPPRPQYPNLSYIPQPAPQPPRTYGGINFADNDEDDDEDDDNDDDDDEDDDDGDNDDDGDDDEDDYREDKFDESDDNMEDFLEKKTNGYYDNDDDNMIDDMIYENFDERNDVKTNIARVRNNLDDLIQNGDGGRENRLTQRTTQQFQPGNILKSQEIA